MPEDFTVRTGTIFERSHVGTQIYSDEFAAYEGLDGLFFSHETVNHSRKEFVRGRAHTNGIESVWAVLKRGLHGVYHHASKKHLHRYVDEFTFRLNEGNVAYHPKPKSAPAKKRDRKRKKSKAMSQAG